jgi:hypothetical protein
VEDVGLRAGIVPGAGIGEAGWLPGGPPATLQVVGSNGLNHFPNLNGSKFFKFFPKLDRPKNDLLELQKFEIKYSFEDLEEVNNFFHWNLFRFRRDFE